MSAFPGPTAPAAPTLWSQRGESVLGSAAASVTFSGLTDSLYKVVANWSPTATLEAQMQLNGDTAGNYQMQYMYTSAGSVSGQRITGASQFSLSNAATIAAAKVGAAIIIIQKPLTGSEAQIQGYNTGEVAGSTVWAETWVGRWLNTSAKITSITIKASTSTFEAGSIFAVDGVA